MSSLPQPVGAWTRAVGFDTVPQPKSVSTLKSTEAGNWLNTFNGKFSIQTLYNVGYFFFIISGFILGLSYFIYFLKSSGQYKWTSFAFGVIYWILVVLLLWLAFRN
jgi:hypothetical protein